MEFWGPRERGADFHVGEFLCFRVSESIGGVGCVDADDRMIVPAIGAFEHLLFGEYHQRFFPSESLWFRYASKIHEPTLAETRPYTIFGYPVTPTQDSSPRVQASSSNSGPVPWPNLPSKERTQQTEHTLFSEVALTDASNPEGHLILATLPQIAPPTASTLRNTTSVSGVTPLYPSLGLALPYLCYVS